MRFLPLSALLLIGGAPVRAQEADALAPDFVYLLGLPGAKNEDLDAYAEAANEIYSKLGVAVRAKRLEHPKTFQPAKLPERSSYVLIGKPDAVRAFLKVADSSIAYIWDDWKGVAGSEPERSQNRFYTFKKKEHKGGGRVIAMDSEGPAFYARLGPCSPEEQKRINKELGVPTRKILKPWTKAQAAALIIVHGSGHNSDFDFGLDHYGRAIMVDGNVMAGYAGAEMSLKLWEKGWDVITSYDRNVSLATYLKARYDVK